MTDQRGINLDEVLRLTQAACERAFPVEAFRDVKALEQASLYDISFFFTQSQESKLKKTRAGACFVRCEYKHLLPKSTLALIVQDPYRAAIIVAQHLYPRPVIEPFIHPSSVIHASAHVASSCHIAAGVVIEENVVIKDRCYIGPHTYVGKNVHIGSHCWLESGISLLHACLGDRVRIKAGACIGQSGFGFIMDAQTCLEIPHKGRVLIEDDVEIGANCTVDRGSFQDTVIGQGTRIDNLVQIAHNTVIGKRVIIAAQCGISGSCVIGDACILGGQVGIADHVHLASGTRVAAKSGVMRSTFEKKDLAGIPAIPFYQWKRHIVKQGSGLA